MTSDYSKTILNATRGFLIFGLTGYTGSGCSSISRLLSLSGPESLKSFDKNQSAKLEDDQLSRVNKKLFQKWDDLDYEAFKPIEISKVIFALALLYSGKYSGNIPHLKVLKKIYNSNQTLKWFRYAITEVDPILRTR